MSVRLQLSIALHVCTIAYRLCGIFNFPAGLAPSMDAIDR